jgi:hypothetical protein
MEAPSTERLARRVVEARAGPAMLLEPAAPPEPAALLGLEDAEEPETVGQVGVVVTEGSAAPGSAAVEVPAARAWADQEPVAREWPVTEDPGAEEDPGPVERERAQAGLPAGVTVGQGAAPAPEGAAVASSWTPEPPDRSCRIARV